MAVEVSKELDSKEAIEHPEEDKEQSHIVDLLARPLEDLVESGFGHRELEAGPNVSNHENNDFIDNTKHFMLRLFDEV